MLLEDLFSKGIMTMGPSRHDPSRQVGVFPPELISRLPARRAAEMQKFQWLAGAWSYENEVPATRASPAYTDVGVSRFAIGEKGNWICMVTADGREIPHITFDPLSSQWIYVLLQGSYGILRSPRGWTDDQIVFSGLMTMVGIDCEWRMTWTRMGDDRFRLVNEERNEDGLWSYIDEWRFQRKH
jgi:hypothetical protein